MSLFEDCQGPWSNSSKSKKTSGLALEVPSGVDLNHLAETSGMTLPLQRKPAGDRGIRYHALAALELGDLPKRIGQVAVVEHQHVRKLLNRSRQILHRAREAGRQLLGRHIVPALQNSHREDRKSTRLNS